MKENKITQISDIEHVLKRPNIYCGSIVNTLCNTFVLDKKTEKFTYQEIEYNPGLLKICYEILDNSVDEALRTEFKFANKIDVTIDLTENKIIVKDNGRGIPLGIDKITGKSQLELALTELRAGSNFNDEEGRNLLGMNGVGSSLTNIFSKEFIVISKDGDQQGTLTCKNNLSEKNCEIIKYKCGKTERGTTVSFIPDLKRFKLTRIGEIHAKLIHQRMMFLSYMYPEITFTFNNNIVKFKNAQNLITAFSDESVVIQDQNKPCKYMIGIIPNTMDDFTHKSYINGADCINGGNHLDYIHQELIGKIKEKLIKRYPNIRAGDIKNKLSYIVCFREFINPMFNSQTKENFSSDINDIKKFLINVDWNNFAQKIVKNDAIISPIIESFKIKEELKNRQALAGMSKNSKKFKCEKFLPATKEQKYLAILEGDSAAAGLVDGLGRNSIGYFSTRGVPLNAYCAKVQKIIENKELENLIKILNLHLNSDKQNMTYENVLLANDADIDGGKIRGLYIGFFSKYCSSIIEENRLKFLQTPLVCLKDKNGNIVQMFFKLSEYKEWEKKNPNSNLSPKYYKGLGSWKADELRNLIAKYGLDRFIETVSYDNTSKEIIHKWLDEKEVEARKEMLRKHKFDIDKS